MQIPGKIFFVNVDSGSVAQSTLQTQLYIDEVITDNEFALRLQADPNYHILVHFNNLHLMVIQQAPYNSSHINWEFADIILFINQGLAYVLDKNSGYPGLAIETQRINLFNLTNIINSNFNKFTCQKCSCQCKCNCFKHLPVPLQRMLLAPWDPSGVHNANCDNEFNNRQFTNQL